MKTKSGFLVAAVVALFGMAAVAGSVLVTDHHHDGQTIVNHGGGLDSCGGHRNTKTGTYHYHRGPYC